MLQKKDSTMMKMKTNKYLIRFSQVGNGSKGGDAILIRLFDDNDGEHLVLIDGGYKETGDKIIKYIRSECSTLHIDAVFNTHPDRDHISGLVSILEDDDITVGFIVMNRPWKDANFTKKMFEDKRITENSLIRRLKDAFDTAEKIEELAKEKDIKIYSGFAGVNWNNILTVLGPSEELYKKGLLGSDKTPESYIKSGLEDYTPTKYSEEEYVKGKTIEWYDEEVTSKVNQTSLILSLIIGDLYVLLTGDAGKMALNEALDYYESQGGSAEDFDIVQLPHHGSRKNIDPEIIKRFKNPKYIISCPPDGECEGHPSRRLINKILELKPTARIFVTKKCNFIFRENVEVKGLTTQAPATTTSKMDGK